MGGFDVVAGEEVLQLGPPPQFLPDPALLKKNYALGLGWGGYVDTQIQFSSFFNADHTLVCRFMLQYPRAYEGPIVACNGSGAFVLSMADFQTGPNAKQLRLRLRICDTEAYYLADPGELEAGKWQHVAITRHIGTPQFFYVFLNGKARSRLPLDPGNPWGGLIVNDLSSSPPKGNIRLGRKGGTTSPTQFYGLIDDFAVFDHVLADSEIAQLVNARIDGNEPGLKAGVTFDYGTPSGDVLPQPLRQTITLGSLVPGLKAAKRIEVETKPDNTKDRPKMMAPLHQVEVDLPFAYGQAWSVLWGWETPTSTHNGFAAFCWDFVIADLPRADGCGQVLHSSSHSPATVFTACDKGDPCAKDWPTLAKGPLIDGYNSVLMQHAPNEFCTYMHVQTGSVVDALGSSAVGKVVQPSQAIAKVGTRGTDNCHLHTGLIANVTIPSAYSGYELRDPQTGAWTLVTRGVPRQGEVVRRPAPDWCKKMQTKLADLRNQRKPPPNLTPPAQVQWSQKIKTINKQIDQLETEMNAKGCATVGF